MSENVLEESLLLEENGQLSLKVSEVPATFKDYYWINQSKSLINARQDLSLLERRLIFALVSLVQPDDEDFKTYTVQIKDLSELMGISDKSIYDRVEKTIDQLQMKQLILNDPEENTEHKITWVQSAKYFRGEGRVRIKLGEDLKPFLLNLKRQYTKFRLKNVIKLRSEYSWRLYELLKEREFRKERIFKITELRYLLSIPDDKYKMLKHLRELLDNAQRELSEKTDITFTYDVHKRLGRSVDSFIFRIGKNENIHTEEEANYDAERLLNLLVSNGVHRHKALQLAKKYHPFYIEENVRQAIHMDASGQTIRNLAGFIVKALEDNYANSIYDTPLDDTLFGIELKNIGENMAEMTEVDIAVLKEIVMTYKNLLNRGTARTTEDLQRIGDERESFLVQNIEKIQERRRKQKKPPLLIEDVVDDPYLKKAYVLWEEKFDRYRF